MNKDSTWNSVGTPIGKRVRPYGEFSIRKLVWDSVEDSLGVGVEYSVQHSIWNVVDNSIELIADSVHSAIKELVQ